MNKEPDREPRDYQRKTFLSRVHAWARKNARYSAADPASDPALLECGRLAWRMYCQKSPQLASAATSIVLTLDRFEQLAKASKTGKPFACLLNTDMLYKFLALDELKVSLKNLLEAAAPMKGDMASRDADLRDHVLVCIHTMGTDWADAIMGVVLLCRTAREMTSRGDPPSSDDLTVVTERLRNLLKADGEAGRDVHRRTQRDERPSGCSLSAAGGRIRGSVVSLGEDAGAVLLFIFALIGGGIILSIGGGGWAHWIPILAVVWVTIAVAKKT